MAVAVHLRAAARDEPDGTIGRRTAPLLLADQGRQAAALKLVGLMSTYREGLLAQGAADSLLECGLDDLLIYEGPAGTPLEADVPPTSVVIGTDENVWRWHKGQWRTDARKRNEMLLEAKRRNGDGPIWGIWLDGDEILVNGRYLYDRLQAVVWNDEFDGSGEPTIRWPMWNVEADGSMALTGGRLFRIDLTRSIDISNSVITNEAGIEEGWGHTNPDARVFVDFFFKAVDAGRMAGWPPLSCEPHIVHRSNLRHPLRRGLRLHQQEDAELRKAGKL
jgi:hypothetical protein